VKPTDLEAEYGDGTAAAAAVIAPEGAIGALKSGDLTSWDLVSGFWPLLFGGCGSVAAIGGSNSGLNICWNVGEWARKYPQPAILPIDKTSRNDFTLE
jgi:hypothetical protein